MLLASDRARGRASIFLLIIAPMVAALTSHPGYVPGDTKLSLYLNPVRLVSDALWTWDHRSFAGWVPHQNVGYLWPSGPFFALFEAIGSPDWIAHRLWITSLMAIAGLGSFRLARHLDLSPSSSLIAGFSFQFSPYVLPYISRTSALLLPWSLLPWLVLVTLLYARTRRLRYLAVFGFLVASSGGLNATALLMIAPGPLIWLFHIHRSRRMSVRSLVVTVTTLASVAVAVSAWWLSGLFIQGRYGAAVLSYSEALESTSATSSSPEVLRGLGYWLFYDRGVAAPLTSASTPYQESVLLLLASAALVVLALWGITSSDRWKRPLATMLLTGVVLAVGAHPFTDSNLLFRPLAENPTNALSLALRSSTRAIPLIVLALALGLGALWDSRSGILRPRLRSASYAAILAVIFANLPAAFNGDLVDRALIRPEKLPSAWQEAGRFLDARYDEGHTGAVLLIPGIESAAYRWGYPVDPILPAISRKPLLTREWLPLGSPAVMDLLYALDDSFQNGTADPDAIAPVARMLGADTVMFVSTHQYERFGTIRPVRAFDVFDPVPPGLSLLAQFGAPEINVTPPVFDSDGTPVPFWSEELVDHPEAPLPEITLFAVEDARTQARQFDAPIIVAADGSGLVDIAAGGILDGSELMLAEASLDDDVLSRIEQSTPHVITDSNRRRAHHWRSSQEVWGATEPVTGVLSVRDSFDSRLPIAPDQQPDSETLIEQADIEATASAYGVALRFHPERRPRMAIDGDPRTAWRIGPDRPATGHVLTIRASDPLTTLRLLQPLDPDAPEWISAVSIRVDSGEWTSIRIDEDSRVEPGVLVELEQSGLSIDIRIDSIETKRGESDVDPRTSRSLGVGFAEVLPDGLTAPEIVRIPTRLAGQKDSSALYVLSRLRSDPYDSDRDDPERSMVRRLPRAESIGDDTEFEVRLSHRASDSTLLQQLGVVSASSVARLAGSSAWWGAAVLDADPATMWWGPLPSDPRSLGWGGLRIPLFEPMDWIEIDESERNDTSVINRIDLTFFSSDVQVGTFSFDLNQNSDRIMVPRFDADEVFVTVVDAQPRSVVDPYTRERRTAPIAVSEIRSNAWTNASLPARFDTGCRNDLVSIDGMPVPVRISDSVVRALDGETLNTQLCFGSLDSRPRGTLLKVSAGADTGWDFDRIVLGAQPLRGNRIESTPLPFTPRRASYTATTPGCVESCWIEMPFGSSAGWSMKAEGRPASESFRTAAGRALWKVENLQAESEIVTTWTPQRFMWWGLGISLVTLIGLAVLALLDRNRSGHVQSSSTSTPPKARSSQRRPSPSRTRAPILGLIGFVLGALIVTPAWAVAVAASLLLIRRIPLASLAVPCVALGYLFIVIQQIRTGATAGFLWPTTFERAHEPMMAVLVVFTVSVHGSHGRDEPLVDD